MEITYQSDRSITEQEFIDLLKSTSLGERRPVDDESCIESMLKEADLLITAWKGDQLIGVARSLTDFHYCCYLSDLAVAETFQNQGVGQALILETEQFLEPGCRLILLAAPQAKSYYPKLGFNQHHSAWTRQVS